MLSNKEKKVAWIVPPLSEGGGGARTIIQNADYLGKNGWQSDIYVDISSFNSKNIEKEITSNFGKCSCKIYSIDELKDDYNVMIATYSINTPDIVNNSTAKYKLYFIQDYEPYFAPMGYEYIARENTYSYGLNGISIGKWLTHKLNKEYGMNMSYFPFCADLNVYKPIHIQKEDAICFIYQPEKPRRCTDLGIQALRIVKKLRPNTKIYFYGSNQDIELDYSIDNLHLISLADCNELYNKSTVGLCISASNPSRIPFEMMASGLPVIDIYRDNNLYDYPNDGVLLSLPTPDAIASALISVLDNEELQHSMSSSGISFMNDYPIDKGFIYFLEYMNNLDTLSNSKTEAMYSSEPFKASDITAKCYQEIINSNKLSITSSFFGKTTIEIKNVFSINKIKELRLALWANIDQSDLSWYVFNYEDNKYSLQLPKLDKSKKQNLHIYAVDENDNMYNIIKKEINPN